MSLTVEFQVKIQYKLCVVQYLVMYILNAFYAKIKLGIRQIPFLFHMTYRGTEKLGPECQKIVRSYLGRRTERLDFQECSALLALS